MKASLDSSRALLEKLIFTDETKLRLFENQVWGENVYVRCRAGERLQGQNFLEIWKRWFEILELYEHVPSRGRTMHLRLKHDHSYLLTRNTSWSACSICEIDGYGAVRATHD
jgi:hypothetical protein